MPKGCEFALETLELERKIYLEKISDKKEELLHFQKETDDGLKDLEEKLADLNAGVVRLGGKAAGGGGNGKRSTRTPGVIKSPAKCNNGKSSWWCYMKCPKNKDRSCKVIKFRTKK